MRVKYEFLTVAALAVLLTACGNEQAMDGDSGNATTARSEIDDTASNDTMTAELEAPRVFEAGASNFEAWSISTGVTVEDSTAMAPDNSRAADFLRLGSNGVVGQAIAELGVEPRDTIEGSVWLWAEDDTQIVLQLVRWCSDTESEVATEVVPVTVEPTRFSISHTFEYAHECVRFQIAGNGTDTNVYAWNALVGRGD